MCFRCVSSILPSYTFCISPRLPRSQASPAVAQRHQWTKFGLEKGKKPGPDASTTSLGSDVMRVKLSVGGSKDAEPEKEEIKVSETASEASCRACERVLSGAVSFTRDPSVWRHLAQFEDHADSLHRFSTGQDGNRRRQEGEHRNAARSGQPWELGTGLARGLATIGDNDCDAVVTVQSSRRCRRKIASSLASSSMAVLSGALSVSCPRLLDYALYTRAIRRPRVRLQRLHALCIVPAVVLQFVASVARARSNRVGARLAVRAEGGSAVFSQMLRAPRQRGRVGGRLSRSWPQFWTPSLLAWPLPLHACTTPVPGRLTDVVRS